MATQNSTRNSVGVKSQSNNAAKQPVSTAKTTRRVAESREQWQVIFDYSVSLVVAYTRGNKPEGDVRKGFAFGPVADQPHSRAYAQSLIGGFITNKAGKVLKDFADLAKRESREQIAYAILLDTKLAKDGTEGAKRILAKAEPKRERAFAEAVLAELSKPEPKAAPKGAKAKGEGKTTKPAPKGAKAKQSAKSAPKGSKTKQPKPKAK